MYLNTPITDFVEIVAPYTNGADTTSPYLSPLRGDLAHGFPATYLRTGTRDLLLSDTVRMHAALRKAGVQAELYVREGMPHSGFSAEAPEQIDAVADTARWLDQHWRLAGRWVTFCMKAKQGHTPAFAARAKSYEMLRGI